MRFKEFTESWESYKVSELLNTIPTNSLSWDQLTYNQESSIKNLHYGLIHNGLETTCITGRNPLFPYINHSFIPTKYTLIQNGDLILADASEDRKDVGKPVEMLDVDKQNIISGLHTIHARNKTNLIENGFKGYYFKSNAMKQQIFKIANGSKIYGISSSAFNELKMFIPEKQEQKKIVDLMIIIEERIQTQIKIIEVLESLKKFLCYQMTHVKADKVMFSKICDFMPKTSHKSSDGLNDGDYVFYTNEETTKLKFNNYDFDGEYIIANTGGKANFKLVTGKFAVMSDCLVIKLRRNSIAKFYYYYLQFNKNYIDRQGFEGSGLKHLNKDWLLKLNVPIINNEHLDYLVLLKKIDKKIKVENGILSNIKLQKEYLLDNLFI